MQKVCSKNSKKDSICFSTWISFLKIIPTHCCFLFDLHIGSFLEAVTVTAQIVVDIGGKAYKARETLF